MTLRYEGLDGVERATRLAFLPLPFRVGPRQATFRFQLPPHGRDHLEIDVHCAAQELATARPRFARVLATAQSHLEALADEDCSIETSNELFQEWLRRSQADLRMMLTETPNGRYPYAGVPWYSTPFGRDAIITALQSLWVNPSLSAGVLEFLANFQATALEDERDAEPGKILHEMRDGEMAALGEVPFARYYGSIDSTPLFVLLAGRYLRATNDRQCLRRLWPSVRRALDWIDAYGDRDRDGFVEYGRRTASGLQQQGWKDSYDSVFHDDGSPAQGPIALCEVQGYVYAARMAAAEIATALGEDDFAHAQKVRASELRARFEQAFWSESLGMYALALDGEKRTCRVRTSNAGHCLFAGIANSDRARRVADQLLEPDMFSGWGVRTVGTAEKLYNPMAYHNGSVWPHDNALIAEGLAAYGFKSHMLRILNGLFQMSCEVELHRLPELICGFERRQGEGPTLYPVACAPQAWAAGSVFMLLGSALGLSVDAGERRVTLTQPALPSWLEVVQLRNLRVGDERVDLTLRRYPEDVALTVERRTGPVDVVVWK